MHYGAEYDGTIAPTCTALLYTRCWRPIAALIRSNTYIAYWRETLCKNSKMVQLTDRHSLLPLAMDFYKSVMSKLHRLSDVLASVIDAPGKSTKYVAKNG